MSTSYDLRAALGDALPAAGPTRAAVKAMDDIGFKADPKNNDMKELFVGLDLAADGSSSTSSTLGTAPAGEAVAGAVRGVGGDGEGASASTRLEGGPSAAQVLLDYRREKKAAREAAEQEAATSSAAGKGSGSGAATAAPAAPAIRGVGLVRATEVAGLELEEAAEDERHLRKVNLSKTAARMSSKQKRRRKDGKALGAAYEDKYADKIVNKSKRKGRMLAMKQMY